MQFEIERRERERRQNHAAAVAYHFAECERRERERRASDSAAVAAWTARFHELRATL